VTVVLGALARAFVVVAALSLSAVLIVPPGVAGATPAQDKREAKRAVLKVSDMPPGWRATKPTPSQLKYFDGIDECRDYVRAVRRSRQLPHAESEFERNDSCRCSRCGVRLDRCRDLDLH
jgi:hypothetical protein